MEKGKYLGRRYLTNEGYWVEVVKILNGRHRVEIKFDGIEYRRETSINTLYLGKIKNPYQKNIYGVGYLGVGVHKSRIKGKSTKSYQAWCNMLERCYSASYHKRCPTYKECYVHPDWHNFQVFAEWFHKNYQEGHQLDKDILNRGNKEYSSNTCGFVPSYINNMFKSSSKTRGGCCIGVKSVRTKDGGRFIATLQSGDSRRHLGTFNTEIEAFKAFKTARESYIKRMANKYKAELTEPYYLAMLNYQVEITD